MYKDVCKDCHNYVVERCIWKEQKDGSKAFLAPCYLTGEYKGKEDSCDKIRKFPVTGKIERSNKND